MTPDSGAGDRCKGTGRDKAGNLKTLGSGAGDRCKGAAQRNKNYYPLAKPRLVEAHDSDSSTVVLCTGQVRSPPGPLTAVNPPYTQHLINNSGNEIEGKLAGPDGNVIEAGQGNLVQDVGAGRMGT